ncbi:hypothetical protein ACHAQI_004612 [Fusarium lateritium]
MPNSADNPAALIASIPSDADNEDSSETESETNSEPHGSVAPDGDDDTSSTVSTELYEAPTLELLELSRPSSPDYIKGPPDLGLNRPWGLSGYDDYDVITVHGLRDDHSTCWKSKSGSPWLKDNLFTDFSIRQLDYSYATDESAQIFRPGGVKAEAQNLLRLYSENRRHLDHIFLGCPHRAESIEVLEDELHNLMCLPGPDIRKGIMRKIRDLAIQVNDVNIQVLEGNLFSRIANINAFYLPELPEETSGGQGKIETEGNILQFEQHSTMITPELPTVPASPFSWYTLTTSNWMEADSRHRQSVISHADLVRGDDGVDKDSSWIVKVSNRLAQDIYPLKIQTKIVYQQAALFSMAPSRKFANVHIPTAKFLPPSTVPSFLARDELKSSEYPIGPQFTYICGLGDSDHTAMLSQYWQVFDSTRRSGDVTDYGGSIFYFEFDKRDKRRNTIRSMLLTYINEMSWRDACRDSGVGTVHWLFESFEYYGCWSLPFLFKLFQCLRTHSTREHLTVFLARFDDCVEDERIWFLNEVLDERSRVDRAYRLVITSSDPDTSLLNVAPEVQILTKKDFPEEPRGFATDEKAIHACGLTPSLQALLDRRPVLNSLRKPLEILIGECQSSPQLGFRIVDWLSNFGRGMPIEVIAATIEKLRPVTPESVLNTFIGSLSKGKRDWAVLVYQWVKYTMEPLTIEALAHALAVSTSSEDVTLADIDYTQFTADIDASFAGILGMEGRDIKFSHALFQDISLAGLGGTDGEQPSFVHGEIARTCLEYLMHSQVQTRYRYLAVENYGGDPSIRPLFIPREGLLEYAVQYWPEHYRLAGSQRPQALAVKLLQDTRARKKWAEAFYLLSNPFTRLQRSHFSPLPSMAALGMKDLVTHQLDLEKDSTWLRTDTWLAITEAARHGYSEVLSTLLNHLEFLGDGVEDEKYLQDALLWAALPDNEDVLSLLIKKANSIDGFKWSGDLYDRAAFSGSTALISALIGSGLDVDLHNSQTDDPAMYTATVWNQPSIAKLLLDAGTDFNSKGNVGRTCILWAAVMCRPEIVQLMLEAGANVEDKDENGVSVVNTAISFGDKESLKIAIAAGADFTSGDDLADSNTNCPIIHAADWGRPGCLRILLEKGADPLTESEKGSILYLVCVFANQVDNCRTLLERGADPNKTYPDKSMTFIHALEWNDTELTELFLNAGAIPDSFDDWEGAEFKTPLTYAARHASYEVMKLLLDHGASPNFCPEGIHSALLEVTLKETADTRKAELLLERGANLAFERSDGWTPLQTSYDSSTLVALFLKHGADVEKQTDTGTILMMAARWGYIETLRTIVAHQDPRPDLNNTYTWDEGTFQGYTALDFALMNGYFDCANLLLQSGADPFNQPMTLRFLMYLDIESKDIDEMAKFTKACMSRGVKLDGKDEFGNSYLHGITSSTTTTVIQILIDAGVPVDSANTAGMTPLAIAVQHANISVTKLLLSNNARVNLHSPEFGSLLSLACMNTTASATDIIEIMKLLIGSGADPNAPGPEPYRPILLQTVIDIREELDRHKLVHYLVENTDIHMDAVEDSQQHPINTAAEKWDVQLFRYLIRHGANFNFVDNLGRLVTHHATRMYPASVERFRIMNKLGVDFLAPDNYGRTPLHLAAAFGYISDLKWLLKHVPGIDLNLRDADGWTPLMWACKLDLTNSAIVEWLVEHGADIWAKSNDGEWSALKIAHMTEMVVDTCECLQPPEGKRERIGPDGVKEIWDPLFHIIDPGHVHQGTRCSSCFILSMHKPIIRGDRHLCLNCVRPFNLCFKCFPHHTTMHNPEHEHIYVIPPTDSEKSVQNEGSVVEGGRGSVSGGSPLGEEAGNNDSEDNESDADSETESGSEE